MSENDRYIIDVLDLALKIIDAMALSQQEYYSPADLTRQLNINRNRTFRVLKTLNQRGFVDYDPKTEMYRLGLKFLTISQNIRERLNIHREAEEILKSLAAETGDCVYLLISAGDAAVVVERYTGDNMLQMSAPIGTVLPFHVGAAPKVLLAFMPDDQRQKTLAEMKLASFTPNTITDEETFQDLLDTIRVRGYSTDEQDYELGAFAFGAPVYDHEGNVVAGMSITTPTTRCSPERRSDLIHQVMVAAQKLSTRLGYQDRIDNRN